MRVGGERTSATLTRWTRTRSRSGTSDLIDLIERDWRRSGSQHQHGPSVLFWTGLVCLPSVWTKKWERTGTGGEEGDGQELSIWNVLRGCARVQISFRRWADPTRPAGLLSSFHLLTPPPTSQCSELKPSAPAPVRSSARAQPSASLTRRSSSATPVDRLSSPASTSSPRPSPSPSVPRVATSSSSRLSEDPRSVEDRARGVARAGLTFGSLGSCRSPRTVSPSRRASPSRTSLRTLAPGQSGHTYLPRVSGFGMGPARRSQLAQDHTRGLKRTRSRLQGWPSSPEMKVRARSSRAWDAGIAMMPVGCAALPESSRPCLNSISLFATGGGIGHSCWARVLLSWLGQVPGLESG